jgi:hypothetical protein
MAIPLFAEIKIFCSNGDLKMHFLINFFSLRNEENLNMHVRSTEPTMNEYKYILELNFFCHVNTQLSPARKQATTIATSDNVLQCFIACPTRIWEDSLLQAPAGAPNTL